MTNYRKMRRQARLARRSGLQPMMVINTGDALPRDRRRGAGAVGLAVPLRARPPRRHRCPGGGRLVAAPHPAALVGDHRGTGRRGRLGGGPIRRAVAIPHADRAHLRRRHHLRGRDMAFRRNRRRSFRAAAAGSAGNRRAYLVGAMVGASAPARESHAGAQTASLARYRQGNRTSRSRSHVRDRGRMGMACAIPAGTRPDHQGSGRENSRDRIRPRDIPGRGAGLPDA